MIRVQNSSFQSALKLSIPASIGGDEYTNAAFYKTSTKSIKNPKHYQNTPKRLYFSKSQLKILEEIGLTRFFKKVDESSEFALRRNYVYNICEHRQSPLMSLIKCSMNMV